MASKLFKKKSFSTLSLREEYITDIQMTEKNKIKAVTIFKVFIGISLIGIILITTTIIGALYGLSIYIDNRITKIISSRAFSDKLAREVRPYIRLMRALTGSDQTPDAAKMISEEIQERKKRLKEIDRVLDRPRKAQEKVAKLMLPFFGDQKVAVSYVGKKKRSLKDWYKYLQDELAAWVDALHERSPITVRDELQKHIREITVHDDGTIVIHGTYQGILAEAGLIEAGDLGKIEIRPEKRRKTKKKAPRQKSKGYTRKNGVPKGI
jgi:hypothetical protein